MIIDKAQLKSFFEILKYKNQFKLTVTYERLRVSATVDVKDLFIMFDDKSIIVNNSGCELVHYTSEDERTLYKEKISGIEIYTILDKKIKIEFKIRI